MRYSLVPNDLDLVLMSVDLLAAIVRDRTFKRKQVLHMKTIRQRLVEELREYLAGMHCDTPQVARRLKLFGIPLLKHPDKEWWDII